MFLAVYAGLPYQHFPCCQHFSLINNVRLTSRIFHTTTISIIAPFQKGQPLPSKWRLLCMLSSIEKFTFFIGRAICHQLPERSFQLEGHYLPVCARDSGIYLGIFSSLMFITLLKRYKNITIPNKKNSFFLLILLLPLVVDGFGSYLGVYSTNNFIRVTTGILFGSVLPFFLIPIISNNSSDKKADPIIKNIRELFIPLSLAGAFVYLAFHSFVSFAILHLLISFTLLIWISLFFYLLFKRLKNRFFSISLSIASSFMVLSVMSYTHSIIRPLYLQNLL